MPSILLALLPTVAIALRMSAGVAPPKMAVMINGLPGAMGREIAAACLRRGVELVPFGLTGPDCGGELSVDDGSGGSPTSVHLYEADGADEVAERLRADYPNAVCIDFTLPAAVNPNSEWYSKHGFPFVMGTTGGDRDALMATVQKANTYCVIAPNMAKQIVALQAALEGMGADFPGSFSGYTLTVQESHQSSKVDTSGTAKAISSNLAQLTAAPFSNDQIEKVRAEDAQLAGGGVSHRGVSPVPKEALAGHAFHTYSLLSGDGQVEFQFRHNVQGRSVYAEGAVDAAIFLAGRVAAEEPQRQFTMVDVLRSGAM
jgi:4-hydroxy-tetrahydrodipicolinate reductase